MMIKEFVKSNKCLYELVIKIMDLIRYYEIKYAYTPFLKYYFLSNVGYPLNLDDPKTFNEKLQWLKCYYRDPIMTQCADKYAVRDLVAKIIGPEYLTPVYGVYDSVAEIDLDELPTAFVLKPTHSSGRVIICKDKKLMDWPVEFRKLSHWLKENYYYQNGEWCYKDIKPRIICEKLLGENVTDYKILCFNGKPKILFLAKDRSTNVKFNFYDLNYNLLPFKWHHERFNDHVELPKGYSQMLKLSVILSKRFPHVRVDWYDVEGKLYFGELTFFHDNGMSRIEPVEWDRKIGDLLDLSKINKAFLKR